MSHEMRQPVETLIDLQLIARKKNEDVVFKNTRN